MVELTVTTQVQTTTMQLTQANTNANLTTLVIKLMKLLVKHMHLKTQNENLKMLKTLLTFWIPTVKVQILKVQDMMYG